MQHRPRHAGQVAQVAVLTLLHHRHLAAGCWSVSERSVFLVSLVNCHRFFLLDTKNTVTMVHIKHLTISHSVRGRWISEVRNVKVIRSVSGSTRDWSSGRGSRGGPGWRRPLSSGDVSARSTTTRRGRAVSRDADAPLARATLRARLPCPSRHTQHAYRTITTTINAEYTDIHALTDATSFILCFENIYWIREVIYHLL